MNKLPVSVVSPVRNSIQAMPAHAAHLKRLAAAAEQVIVVDSDSEDGTLDFLKKELAGSDVLFLNHPPGLYESWNFGIAAAAQPYCTIATVGDPLPVDSLKQLVDTLEKFSADAVISAPEMIADGGKPSPRRWPIHQIIAEAQMKEPQLISPAAWLTMTLGYFPATLLSSNAGNLYRTSVLQENPFPVEYGHAGDCAWALRMSRKVRWVIDPTVKSYFWVHPVSASRKKRSEARVRLMHAMATEYFAESEAFLRAEKVPDEMIEVIRSAPEQMLQKALAQIQYAAVRKSYLPRFMQREASRLKRMQRETDKIIDARHAQIRAFAKAMLGTKS